MADNGRPRRPRGDGPGRGGPRKDRPGNDGPRKDGPRQGGPRQDSSRRDDRHRPGYKSTPKSGSSRPERPARAPRSSDRRPSGEAPRFQRRERTPVEPEPVFPDVDTDVEPKMLDRIARRELTALGKEEAEFVASHLVMAGRVIEDDPALALAHAQAAAYKGSRIAVVRETVGIAAYQTGDFALSLRELRTHRRLSGSDANLPMMVDCERGLGRPDKAIELAHSVDPNTLDTTVRVELAIALSGARLDKGQADKALLELQIPELNPDVAYRYSPALFDAYAVVLDELGRSDEAATWGSRANVAAEALEAAQPADDGLMVDDALDPSIVDEPAVDEPAVDEPVALRRDDAEDPEGQA